MKLIGGRENIIEQPIGKITVFKIKSMEGDNKMEVVHRHLLLSVFPDPSDHTSDSYTKSVVDQTVSTHEVIAVGAAISHEQNMGAYSRIQITGFHEDWSLLLLCLNNGNTVIYWV